MSQESISYRQEWKIPINHFDSVILRSRLQQVMQPDRHASHGDGIYFIRSLYFDTPEDTALREKLDGVNRREKYRIRYYDYDISKITLEKKFKHHGVGTKFHAPLSVGQTQQLVDGDIAWMSQSPYSLIQELYYQILTKQLRPTTIVDYTREAYVYQPGNIRVTLDYNLRTGLSCTKFLDQQVPTIAPPDEPMVMEVKWDHYLPDVIRAAVHLPGCHVTAFSKYAACRL